MTKSQIQGASAQLNLGSRARIAGRDYYESKIPDSIRMYLATTPSDRIDTEAIDNERLFTYRFGIDVPKPVREQLLKMKNDHGLTDREIRWLRRSGQLKISRAIAELRPDRVLPAVGWFYAILLAVFCGSMAVLIAASPADAWKQAAGLIGVLGLWAIATWFTKQLFIAPWHWVRHITSR